MQTRKIKGLFGKRLNLYHKIPGFNDFKEESLNEKSILRKEENADNQHFLLFLRCFSTPSKEREKKKKTEFE